MIKNNQKSEIEIYIKIVKDDEKKKKRYEKKGQRFCDSST